MNDYTKSEGYIFANLCSGVSRALYEAMLQKRWSKHKAEMRAHGGDMTLRQIAQTLTQLGAHMEVRVKFIDEQKEIGDE